MVIACDLKQEEKIRPPRIPWPEEGMAKFLQAQVDSSQFEWFLDVKASASSFCNEEVFTAEPVSTADVIILGEGVFHAQVEVRLVEKTIILDMERPYKTRGVRSIWQVVKLEEKK
jgi:hypothetical protein